MKIKGVFQRGDNYYIDYYANGRRKREKIGPSQKLAKTVLKKRQVEIAEGKYLDISKEQRIRFEDFVIEFLNLHSKPNKKSWQTDEYNLQAFEPNFNGRYLGEITTQDIEAFKAKRINEVSPSTVNRELSILRTLYNKAIAWGRITKSPLKDIKMLKEPEGRLVFLEKKQISTLLSNCDGNIRGIITVAIFCGFRKGEILSLQWRNCDFQRRFIRITDTKNGEGRTVPMCDIVYKTLISIPKHPTTDYIFCNKDGERIKDIRKAFAAALKKSEIDKETFRFHDLRHTCGAWLIMSGVDMRTVQEILGHKDLRMTLRYTHLTQSHKKHAVDLLNNRLEMDPVWPPEPVLETDKEMTVSELQESKRVV